MHSLQLYFALLKTFILLNIPVQYFFNDYIVFHLMGDVLLYQSLMFKH